MDFLKDQVLNSLNKVEDKKISSPKKRSKGKSLCCTLYPKEVEMLKNIKDKGFDNRIAILPSKIVRIGLLLIVQTEAQTISQAIKENNKNQDKFSITDKLLNEEKKTKNKSFTFFFDEKGAKDIEKIKQKGLDVREAWTYSQIIRLAIAQANTLSAETLKKHYESLPKKEEK